MIMIIIEAVIKKKILYHMYNNDGQISGNVLYLKVMIFAL